VRAALYARVSKPTAQSPEMQIAELRDYCQRRGWELLDCSSTSNEKQSLLVAVRSSFENLHLDAVSKRKPLVVRLRVPPNSITR
jgi:DNA invertase Pin-like site-specific DNA recombinase